MADDWKKQLAKIKREMAPTGKSASPSSKRKQGTAVIVKPALPDGPSAVRPPPPKGPAKRPTPRKGPAKWVTSRPPGPSSTPDVKKQPATVRFPDEPRGGAGKTFNIGIDFGTSSTKVCARPPGKDAEVHVLPLEEEDKSGSRLCPSSVAVCGNEIFFGRQAEQMFARRGGKIFRQLKVCLACEVGIQPVVPAAWCQGLREPHSGHCSACFALGGQDREALASDLITLFLAWAMGQARLSLTRTFCNGKIPRTTYSLSAPIDQMDEGLELNGEYARIAYNAWRLSDAVTQGMAIDEALGWVANAQSLAMPDPEDLLVELCPEGGAGIAGFALAPEMDEGLYCLVDIGAWTTEISFFRFSDVGIEQSGVPLRAFYASRSHRVAANQIDDRCREYLLTLYPHMDVDEPGLVEGLRNQRERRVFGEASLEPFLSKPQDVPKNSPLQLAQDVVAEGIFRSFTATLREAFDKEKSAPTWQGNLRLLYAGGGSKDPVLHRRIDHGFIKGVEDVPPPRDLIGLPRVDDYRHFLVAYGLSHGSVRWPRDLLPSRTLPLKPRVRKQPSFEELGFGR